MEILKPTTPAELAEALAAAASAGRQIALGGEFSKNSWAGPLPASADVTVSTAALDRVLIYEPNDLTISVEAGMSWAALTELLARNRQMIPLDPPCNTRGTVGGVIAANLSGPRRRLYGTARDMVIGMKFATVAGKVIQSGGMVVKNVAGLDISKLLIGSFGTLAAIASVNFKLTPAPPGTRTFVRSCRSSHEAIAARDQVLRSVLQPCALDILNPEAATLVSLEGYCVLLQAGGSEALLDRYTRELNSWEAVSEAIWDAVRQFSPHWLSTHPGGAIVRFSHLLNGLGTLLDNLELPIIARAGSGVTYAAFADASEAPAAMTASGMRSVIESTSEENQRRLTLWPEPGDDFAMMEKVKEMFDPARLLNRGRLYGRI